MQNQKNILRIIFIAVLIIWIFLVSFPVYLADKKFKEAQILLYQVKHQSVIMRINAEVMSSWYNKKYFDELIHDIDKSEDEIDKIKKLIDSLEIAGTMEIREKSEIAIYNLQTIDKFLSLVSEKIATLNNSKDTARIQLKQLQNRIKEQNEQRKLTKSKLEFDEKDILNPEHVKRMYLKLATSEEHLITAVYYLKQIEELLPPDKSVLHKGDPIEALVLIRKAHEQIYLADFLTQEVF